MRTPEELKRLADRQLARIRRGEPMLTLDMIPSRAKPNRCQCAADLLSKGNGYV